MLSQNALEQWCRQAHGPRVQVKAICYISTQLEMHRLFSDSLHDDTPTLTEILLDCRRNYVRDVSASMLRRWLYFYMNWGELGSREEKTVEHSLSVRQEERDTR